MSRNTHEIAIPFNEVTLDLARSPQKVSVGKAVILKNMDFDDERGVLVGRYGTYTENNTETIAYPFYDLFNVTDADTGKKYQLATYKNGSNYYLAARRRSPSEQTAFTTLKTVAGADFTLTARPTCMVTREPTLNDIIAICTNGVEQPFYWTPSESGGNITVNSITSFAFGGAAPVDYRPKFILNQPWHGRAWFTLREGEETMWWWSDSDNFLSNVAVGNAGFRAAPQDQPNNPSRGGVVLQDRLVVFNVDTIGEFYYTGNSSDPFHYREILHGVGAIHPRAITEWNGKIYFLDKRAPYLKCFNGSSIELIDPTGSIEKGFEKWMDISDVLNVRMDVRGSNLLVSFKVQPTYATTGTDGNRWLAVINLTQPNDSGYPYFPFNLWDVRTNDIAVADEGTDAGLTYFTDPDTQGSVGYVRRIMDWYDIRAGGVGFGDDRNVTGSDPTAVANQFRTGWIDFGQVVNLVEFRLDGDFEGTPSVSAALTCRFRFEGWTEWITQQFGQVRTNRYYPVDPRAYGRKCQLEFLYSDTQSRPKLNSVGLKVKLRPGVYR